MLFRKFIYAFRGIGKALREEISFRVMTGCFVLVVAAGLLLRVTALEWAVLLLCCGAVLAAEMVNTALERAVDIAAPEKHPLAEAAKDIAAGAVLMISLFAVAVGLFIFLPHVITLFAQ
jgi:Diacylglycerol kinase